MSLLTGAPRTATVRSLERGVVVGELPKAALVGVFKTRPEVSDEIAKVVAERQLANSVGFRKLGAAEQEAQKKSFASRLANSMGVFFGQDANEADIGAMDVSREADELKKRLQTAPVLALLSSSELHKIIAHGLPQTELVKGAVVFEQGMDGDSMFLVLDGAVQVLISREAVNNGQPIAVAELGRDQIFGEMSMLTGAPRSATVMALSGGAKVCEIKKAAIQDVLQARPALVDELSHVVADRQLANSAGFASLGADEKEKEKASFATRLASSMGNFFMRKKAGKAKASAFAGARAEASGLLESLKAIPLLAQLSASELQLVIAHGVPQRQIVKGQAVVKQGEPGDSMYLVLEGSLSVLVSKGGKKPEQVARLEKGQFFGEMSLFTGESRSASVEGLQGGAKVCEVEKAAIAPVLQARPLLAEEVAGVITDRQLTLKPEHASLDPYAQMKARRALLESVSRKMADYFGQSGVAWTGEEAVLSDEPKVRTRQLTRMEAMVSLFKPLTTVPFFATLKRQEVMQMFISGVKVHTYQPGATVFQQGSEGDSLFVVLEGAVEVLVNTGVVGKSKSVRVAVLSSGMCFGEMAIFTGAPRTADVLATDKGAKIFEIEKQIIAPIIGRRSELAEEISVVIAEKQVQNRQIAADDDALMEEVEKVALRINQSIQSFFGRDGQEDNSSDGEADARRADSAGDLKEWKAQLVKFPLFQHFTRTELHGVLMRGVEQRAFAMGTKIIRQGDTGDSMFVVLEGSVAVYLTVDGGRQRKVNEMGDGNYFGEMSLLTGQDRMATVVSLAEGAVCLEIPKDAIVPVLLSRPTLMDEMAQSVAERKLKVTEGYARLSREEQERERKATAVAVTAQITRHFSASR